MSNNNSATVAVTGANPPSPDTEDPRTIADETGDVLAADVIADDGSSESGASLASSTTSVTSSILEYRIENGRTYHKYKDGKYWVPNDERENDRLGQMGRYSSIVG
ncbi:methyltransferase domain-containing protein [Colletotrichum tofieldiae]|uniref:Methyltransferase domain-containing protein n=1 Tax=Colletotrichum tofieldiae TaxID=708197 RepID=A0A166XEP3_9PEZI|nr:methyltransferase domain-containing protein [Colletotrichum tofieldiae]